MKIIALLSGLLASAFAWGAGIYVTDVGVQFLDLWPETISQQFLGLVIWHAIVAAAMVGGILAVLSPISGALLLIAVAAGWAWLAATLPVGFTPQMIVPIALAGIGALAALGAMIRGRARRQTDPGPSAEDLEREEALRFEPSEDVTPLFGDQTEAEPQATSIAPQPEPRRRADDAPPHGISGAMALNVAVLLVLVGAVALLAYSEFRSGDLMAAFSSNGPRATRVALGAPSATEDPAPAVSEPAPVTDEDATPEVAVESDAPASAASPEPEAPDNMGSEADAASSEQAPAETATVASLADPSQLPASTSSDGPWGDPFSYCSAVGTVDFPDHRYDGPRLVAAIANALRVPESSSPDRVKWRCYEGAVMACAAFDRPICAMTPTVAEMVEFCAQNPDATDLLAPNGRWSCEGSRPVIPEGDNWPVDARGFLPGAWQAVARPDTL